eukprot:COSAG03_NODE_11168_length_608_cov_1.168959_2_plen_61_part_01
MSTVTVNITKGEGGFGMRISAEGVVTGYSVPGGAAEVRDRQRRHATVVVGACGHPARMSQR